MYYSGISDEAGHGIETQIKAHVELGWKYLELRSVDGENMVSELRVQGEALQLDAQELVTLTLGNARGVRIEVNGEDFEIPQGRGGVVSDLVIRLRPDDEAIEDSFAPDTGVVVGVEEAV